MALLSDAEIAKCMRQFPGNFLGVFPMNRLPQNVIRMYPFCFIVNTDHYGFPGKHWIAVYCTRTHADVFDPLAGQLPTLLTRWVFRRYGSNWTTNKSAYQFVLSTLCGAYCIWYLFKRFYVHSMDHVVIELFPGSPQFNDSIIRDFFKMTC